MKKIALISAALLIATATAASASTILNSRHDLRSKDQNDNSNAELCIYCHTPHNAKINVPLWNRNNPSGDWTLYNTSKTLTTAAQNSSISTDSISLFCMSCHDGITAMGDVINKNPYTNSYTGVQTTGGVKDGSTYKVPAGYARIGGNDLGGYNLANTHPIGFDFIAARNEDNGLRSESEILTLFEAASDKTTRQNFLYARPATGGDVQKWFECASCHRVHDPGPSGNFLRLENQGSQLCLACHNK